MNEQIFKIETKNENITHDRIHVSYPGWCWTVPIISEITDEIKILKKERDEFKVLLGREIDARTEERDLLRKAIQIIIIQDTWSDDLAAWITEVRKRV